jgi:hypothetical protein
MSRSADYNWSGDSCNTAVFVSFCGVKHLLAVKVGNSLKRRRERSNKR